MDWALQDEWESLPHLPGAGLHQSPFPIGLLDSPDGGIAGVVTRYQEALGLQISDGVSQPLTSLGPREVLPVVGEGS